MAYRPGPPPKDWPAVERELWRISQSIGTGTGVVDPSFDLEFDGDTTIAMGVPYLSNITPNEDDYTYSIYSGALPPGLSLLDNRIIGFPYESGLYTATLRATAANGNVGEGTVSFNVYGSLTAMEVRKAQIAAKAAAEPVPGFTGSGKYVHANVEARLLCDITDEEALTALRNTTTVAAYQKNQFGAASTARLYVKFKGQLPSDIQAQMLASAKDNVFHQYAIGTENINLMRKCAGILFGESEPTEVFAWDNGTNSGTKTGAEMASELKAEMFAWIQAMWSNNEWEFRSPVYASVTQMALLFLIEYSTDAEIVSAAQLLFDHLVHNVHVHAVNNVIFPSKRNRQRVTAGTPQGDIPEWGTQWTDWVYFGSDYDFVPQPEHPHQRSAYFAALSEVTPSGWVLAYNPTKPFTAKFRNPSLTYNHPDYVNDIGVYSNTLSNLIKKFPVRESFAMTKAYVTDHYTLADGKFYDVFGLEGYDDYFGCWWKGKSKTPRILVCHPYANWNRPILDAFPYEDDEPEQPDPGDPLEDEDNNMESPFKSSGQRDNVQSIIFDIVTPDPYLTDFATTGLLPFVSTTPHPNFYIYIPDDLTYKLTESGIRYYQDGDIYVGIKTTVAVEEQETIWSGYSRLKVAGPLAGMWLAIGHADEYGSFGDFRVWLNGATFTDNLATTGTLSYSNAGATLDVTKHNGTYPLIPTVTIDSVAEDPTAWNRREWPGIRANNGYQLFCTGADQVPVLNWSQHDRADFWLWETNISVTSVSSDTLTGSVPAQNEARLYASANEYWDVDNFDLVIDDSVVPDGTTVTEVRVYRVGDRPAEYLTGDDRTFDSSIGNWVAVGTNVLSHDAVNGWAYIDLDLTDYLGCYVVVSGLTVGVDYTVRLDIKAVDNVNTKWLVYTREDPDVSGTGPALPYSAAGVVQDGVELDFTATSTTHRVGVGLGGSASAGVKFDNVTVREATKTRPSCA